MTRMQFTDRFPFERTHIVRPEDTVAPAEVARTHEQVPPHPEATEFVMGHTVAVDLEAVDPNAVRYDIVGASLHLARHPGDRAAFVGTKLTGEQE